MLWKNAVPVFFFIAIVSPLLVGVLAISLGVIFLYLDITNTGLDLFYPFRIGIDVFNILMGLISIGFVLWIIKSLQNNPH